MAQTLKQDVSFIEPEVTKELGAEFGLSSEEYDHVLEILGRLPTYTELGIFSVMWSEHCSYKSSRVWLAKLPTKAPWVIQGPGENAGVIDIGDNQAAVFKMESHNHPSFIEPFQGAATGVGGIMRDVFTMGARPIANVNALRFGEPENSKTRHLLSGVVSGISHYGNCMGVPTVAGETQFHKSYNGNILVNAMTVGLADQDKIFYAKGAMPDMPVVYVGSKTGRDGIHGATMASTEFSEGSEENRPTVQVGDPYTEKLLLEACLELMQSDAIVSIQDMGAAGLTSSSVEIADKGNIGVTLDLDKVPQREPNMMPYEIMLSESQERMLIILKPGREDQAKAIFEKWELDFAVIGTTTTERSLKLNMYGKTWCDVPVPPLVDDAPKYNRPYKPTPQHEDVANQCFDKPDSQIVDILKQLIASPNLASKRWIWEQYDSLVRGETMAGPGQSDAALIRIPGHDKALAISSDCNPTYCYTDPFEGGKQAVAESWRNIIASGAQPKAVTNNLNFGNPENPKIMGQFVGCIEGMIEACNALEYPVISGNVSLYNETSGDAILPTPVIGGVGVLNGLKNALTLNFKGENEDIFIIGQTDGHIGQSLFLNDICKHEGGQPPKVDLALEKKNGSFIQHCNSEGILTSCHDISEGGLLVALAEMVMASNMGAKLNLDTNMEYLFGEDQARYIVTVSDGEKLIDLASKHDVFVNYLGKTGGESLQITDSLSVNVSKLKDLNENWLPNYMAGNA